MTRWIGVGLLLALGSSAACVEDLRLATEGDGGATPLASPSPSATPDPCAFRCARSSIYALAAAADGSTGALLRFDPESGARISAVPLRGGAGRMAGMSWDPRTGRTFAVQKAVEAPELVTIDLESGEVQLVAPIVRTTPAGATLALVDGMAMSPCNGRLYASGGEELFSSELLFEVDPTSAEAEFHGRFAGLSDGDLLVFMGAQLLVSDVRTDTVGQSFFDVDIETALVERRGDSEGFIAVEDLAWDPLRSRFYGIDSEDRRLYVIDPEDFTRTPLAVAYTDGEFDNDVAGIAVVCR